MLSFLPDPKPNPIVDEYFRLIHVADLLGLQALLQQSPRLANIKDHQQRYGLHYAIIAKQTDLILFLIAHHLKERQLHPLVYFDMFGFTPLHYAAMSNQAMVADILLNTNYMEVDQPRSVQRDQQDLLYSSETPLYYAIISQSADMVKMLISRGAKTNRTDRKGKSFDDLMRNYFPEGIPDLHPEINNSPTLNSTPPVNPIASKKRLRDGNTELHEAVENNDLEMVSSLLIAGADPICLNDKGESPTRLAWRLQYIGIFQYLLGYVDRNSQEYQQCVSMQISSSENTTVIDAEAFQRNLPLWLKKSERNAENALHKRIKRVDSTQPSSQAGDNKPKISP